MHLSSTETAMYTAKTFFFFEKSCPKSKKEGAVHVPSILNRNADYIFCVESKSDEIVKEYKEYLEKVVAGLDDLQKSVDKLREDTLHMQLRELKEQPKRRCCFRVGSFVRGKFIHC